MAYIIRFSAFLSVIGVLSSPIVRYPFIISCLHNIGPFLNNIGKVDLYFEAYCKEDKDDIVFDFFVSSEHDPNEKWPNNSTREFFNISANDVINFDLYLDTSYFSKYNPCDFAISATEYNNWYFNPLIEFTLWEQKIYDFDIKNLIDKGDFENPYFYVNIKENNVTYNTDVVNFSKFPLNLEPLNYDILDLSSFKFKYLSNVALKYSEFYLYFNDTKNIFPFVRDSKGIVRLDIIPVKNNEINNEYALTFKNKKMYVNPNTKQMSFLKRTGFSLTNNFYLPKGGKEIFENYELHLIIKGLGKNLINYHYDFNYASNNNLFGNCQDSSFCVIEGKK